MLCLPWSAAYSLLCIKKLLKLCTSRCSVIYSLKYKCNIFLFYSSMYPTTCLLEVRIDAVVVVVIPPKIITAKKMAEFQHCSSLSLNEKLTRSPHQLDEFDNLKKKIKQFILFYQSSTPRVILGSSVLAEFPTPS